jgi:hypothetical protein
MRIRETRIHTRASLQQPTGYVHYIVVVILSYCCVPACTTADTRAVVMATLRTVCSKKKTLRTVPARRTC